MTGAPVRIWACMGGPMVGMFVSGGNNGGWPEYVRADLHDTMRAQLDATIKDRAMIIAERDRTFKLMLERVAKAEAERDRVAAEWADVSHRNYQRAKAAEAELDRIKADRTACQVDYCALMDRLDAATSLQKPQTTPAPVWHFLDEWHPPEGTWAILWPGYYGPFTACRIGGEWSMCDDQDLNNATIATPCPEPRHDMTDHFVIKEWDE